MFMRVTVGFAAIGMSVLLAGVAGAHDGVHTHVGFAAGLTHPFSGFDHLLAAVAVGAWAGRLGVRTRIALPGVFLLAGTIAGFVAWASPATIGVEPFVLGATAALIAFAGLGARTPAALGVTLAAAFAVPHGYAHIAEAGASAAVGSYATGLVLSTAGLIAAGLTLSLSVGRPAPARSRG